MACHPLWFARVLARGKIWLEVIAICNTGGLTESPPFYDLIDQTKDVPGVDKGGNGWGEIGEGFS